jgi:hypothetical protein
MVVVKGCPKRPQQVASALIEITEIYCNTTVVSGVVLKKKLEK